MQVVCGAGDVSQVVCGAGDVARVVCGTGDVVRVVCVSCAWCIDPTQVKTYSADL